MANVFYVWSQISIYGQPSKSGIGMILFVFSGS